MNNNIFNTAMTIETDQSKMVERVRHYAQTFKGEVSQPFGWVRFHGVYDYTTSANINGYDAFANLTTGDCLIIPHVLGVNITATNSVSDHLSMAEESIVREMLKTQELIAVTINAASETIIAFVENGYDNNLCFAPLPETKIMVKHPLYDTPTASEMTFLVCKR